ncbi:MAG: single-stranded-DNA-specific exonuclease RecJ [Patescibacteria group bacterium]
MTPRKFDDLIDQLLYNRGLIDDEKDEEKKLEFFHPNFDSGVHDPFLLKDMEGAVGRIKKAHEAGETVGIFADYDADGIPGAALLYRALRKIGIKTVVYIPNREGGYGLSPEGIDYLVENKCSLIVTIDLGIRNIKEAEYCEKIGVDLIITDHHLPGDELPKPKFLINAKQKGDGYPFKELCGCAVGFKVIQALAKYFPKELDEKFLKWNLDLVAISTISDVVPLIGENRVLAKFGLMVMRKTKNLGLSKLIDVAGIDPKAIQAYHVGFQIGPRINAPGRIDHATKSFELLVSEDEKEALDLAKWLNTKNEERQGEMDKVEKEAIAQVEEKNLTKNKILIVVGDWQKGVIGPSASRLVEKYNRPVILFSREKDTLTGSARSISAINIVELFERVKDTILKFGGHKAAAGITISEDKLEQFTTAIEDIANKEISDEQMIRKLKIDAEVHLSEMTKTLYEKLLQFEPYGMGNSKPVFVASNTELKFSKFIGKESNHFSAVVGDNPHRLKLICFNFPYDKNIISDKKRYDIVFNLNLDTWQGEDKLSMNVQDMRASQSWDKNASR